MLSLACASFARRSSHSAQSATWPRAHALASLHQVLRHPRGELVHCNRWHHRISAAPFYPFLTRRRSPGTCLFNSPFRHTLARLPHAAPDHHQLHRSTGAGGCLPSAMTSPACCHARSTTDYSACHVGDPMTHLLSLPHHEHRTRAAAATFLRCSAEPSARLFSWSISQYSQ